MARMGGSKHMKALAAPRVQRIPRKERPWTVKPSPGPHPIDRSLPLLVVLRDYIKVAETSREARKIVAEGQVKVDGRVVSDYKRPIGIMDVIEITSTGQYFRALPHTTGTLTFIPIDRSEALIKPARVEGVNTIKGGHFEYHLSGGVNALVKVQDPSKPGQMPYRPLDTLILELPSYKIKDRIEFKEGNLALVIWGRNMGRYGNLISVTTGWGWKRRVVALKDQSGVRFETSLDNIFIIGRDKPIITLPK